MKPVVAYIDSNLERIELFKLRHNADYSIMSFETGISFYNWYIDKTSSCEIIAFAGAVEELQWLEILKAVRIFPKYQNTLFLLAGNAFSFTVKKLAISNGVTSMFYLNDLLTKEFVHNVALLLQNRSYNPKPIEKVHSRFKTPVNKRVFDLVFSAIGILILSPVLLIISILILLQDGFPIVYASKRVGAGYQVFNFYKFRTMIKDADSKMANLKHLNQYGKEISPKTGFQKCEACLIGNLECDSKVFLDSGAVCEKTYLKNKDLYRPSAFIKIKSDPRITKFGQFLRNTSLDELPQLFNVLIGDMSLVGNRPLPVYEAEKLTTDQMSQRFMAPAGITGLWQVSKRGHTKMSAEERQQLDNNYALNYSLKTDFQILLKTVPALIQKENV